MVWSVGRDMEEFVGMSECVVLNGFPMTYIYISIAPVQRIPRSYMYEDGGLVIML
jgi:hypothetical protein